VARDVFGIVGTTQAGRFKIERVVAEGGFGVVYKAQHASFRAPVALKLLKVPESMSDEAREHFFERFRAEGELLFRLSQAIPEVVRPLHVDVIDLAGRAVPFLALEWLEGETLDRVVAKRRAGGLPPLGLYQAVKLLAPIASALARAHRFPGPDGIECVVHRDLKPENIFIAKIGGVEIPKILDFGIARAKSAAAEEAGRVTDGDGLTSFTPGYAAPEQWLPKRYGQPGPWTDVYGLAMTLVEVLTGHAPVAGDLATMMATTIDDVRRPTPRAEGVAIADEAEAAFAFALAVDPRERAKAIEPFWTRLERALGMPPTILPAPVSAAPSIELASADFVETFSPTIDLPIPDGPPPLVRRPAIPDLDAPGPVRDRISSRPAPANVPLTLAEEDGRYEPHALDGPLATARPKFADRPADEPRAPIDRFAPPPPTLIDRIRPSFFYAKFGVAIVIADLAYTYFQHAPLALFGFHLAWLAGPIVAIGIGIAAWRLFAHQD
jgi:serine/threonine-protein kinase